MSSKNKWKSKWFNLQWFVLIIYFLIANPVVQAATVNKLATTSATASGAGAGGVPSISNFTIPAGKNRVLFISVAFERDHCSATDNCTSSNTANTGLGDNWPTMPYATDPQITARITGTGGTIDKKNALTVGGIPSGDLRYTSTYAYPNTIQYSFASWVTYHIALYESDINSVLGGTTSGNVNITLPDSFLPSNNAGDDAILFASVFENVQQSVTGIVRNALGSQYANGSTIKSVAGNISITNSTFDTGQAPTKTTDGNLILGLNTSTEGFATPTGFNLVVNAVTSNSNGNFDTTSGGMYTTNEPNGFSAAEFFNNGIISSFTLKANGASTTSIFGAAYASFLLAADNADASDAPASYGNATHEISGIRLGASVDADTAILASSNAQGDDTNNSDDENGVTMPASITAGQTVSIPLSIQSASGRLNVWFDWNQDGDFLDSGEQVTTDLAVTTATTSVNVTAPSTASAGNTFARFRVCTNTAECNTPVSTALSGEVEDYIALVTLIDYGDAPDAAASTGTGNYQTTAADGGPKHTIIPGLAIGRLVDADSGTLQNTNADADDTNNTDDDDGVNLPQITTSDGGKAYTITTYVTNYLENTTMPRAYLVAYMDLNRDGDFLDSGERSATQFVDASTYFYSSFTLPASLTAGNNYYLRIRVGQTQAQVESPTAAATSGEVEDYKVTVVSGTAYDYGDAPASYGDAKHALNNNIYLGDIAPDAEAASQYSYAAFDDGLDEDGAPRSPVNANLTFFPTLKLTAANYSVDFKVTNTTGTAAKLYAWIDFNDSGTFESTEGTVVNVPSGVTKGSATLTWSSIPSNIKLGTTVLRARLTTDSTVTLATPTGTASNGEVEDYPIAISLPLPADSSAVSIVSGVTNAACEAVILQDNFNDLTGGMFWGANRPGSQPIRNWTNTGGGTDTYARIVDMSSLGQGMSVYFGNGSIREINPPINAPNLTFDTNGRLLNSIESLALRDDMDDLTPNSTVSAITTISDWGPNPVTLSRTFNTTAGKSYRLYFKAVPESGSWSPGFMRIDTPSGSIHFKTPGGTDGIQQYAIEFTANAATSTIAFVNYGHLGMHASGWCDPNSLFTNNAWCTVGGLSNDQQANELMIDDVVVTDVACAIGAISGTVFNDLNKNAIYDTTSETGIGAIKVTLYDQNNTPNTQADDRLVYTTDTASNGVYTFSNLNTNRTYRIEVDTTDSNLPSNTTLTTTNPLTNIAVTANTTTTNQNFGFAIPTQDYGDAPATYGAASHTVVSGLYLGTMPDKENLSKYSYNARADNNDDGAPSQPIYTYIPIFPILQLTDNSYQVNFKATNSLGKVAKLYAWIDFDKSGTFETDEATSVDVPNGSANTSVTLKWATIPLDIKLGTVAMRARLTSDSSVTTATPTGNASDGEVEDYPIAIAMDIPPNSPSIAIVAGATPAACETILFQDNFDDLSTWMFWGNYRADGYAIRNWKRSGGGTDSYAQIQPTTGYGNSVYFGNGGIREISPPLTSESFTFDSNGKLLNVIDAIALRDDMDDVSPNLTLSTSDWGPEPVQLSRTFNTVVGKSYRLYFKAFPERPGDYYNPGIMRLDTPGGSIHFKAPGSAESMQQYAVEFTATSTTSTITFINYGHGELSNNNQCDPNSVGGPWCTIGGPLGIHPANELIIDDVILTDTACSIGSISGTVYLDANQSNVLEAGESGLANISVKLYDQNGTSADYNDDRLVLTTSTGINGSYSFANLNTARTYRIVVDTVDPDLPNGATIGTPVPLINVAVAANSATLNQNFGFDVISNADLSVVKTDGVTSVSAGSSTTYTITVTNNGPSASTATLTDPSVTGLSKTAVACGTTPGVCTTAPTIANLEAGFTTPSIASGGTYQLKVTATVTATSGSVANTATVATPSGTTDPTSSNNSSTDTDTITTAPTSCSSTDLTLGNGLDKTTGSNPYTGAFPSIHSSSLPAGIDNSASILVGGNFTITLGAEAEGKVVVLGNMKVEAGSNFYDLAQVGAGSQIIPEDGEAALLVGGNLTVNDAFNVGLGKAYNARIHGSVGGTSTVTLAGTLKQNDSTLDLSGYQAQLAALNIKSQHWKSLPATGTVTVTSSEVILSGNGKGGVQVFNVAPGQLNLALGHALRFTNLLANGTTNGASTDVTVLINVLADASGTAYLWNLSNMFAPDNSNNFDFNTQLGSNILWNFPDATNIQFGGPNTSEYWGTVVVPNSTATLYMQAPGMDGRMLVAGNLIQNKAGSEFHNYKFDPSHNLCDSYTNDYCVTASGTTGLLPLGNMPTADVTGAGTFNYTNRVLPGFGTVDVAITMTGGNHKADTTAIDSGGKQTSWLDEGLPNTSGSAIYLEPNSGGTATLTYNFDQPTGNLDLLVMDVDFEDTVTITAKDGSGAAITDFSGWRYRSGDFSTWQNPDPVAQAPSWNASTATLTSTDDSNDHRSFGLLTPDTLVTQIVIKFTVPAVSGRHIYSLLHTTTADRDGQTSCPATAQVSGTVFEDMNYGGGTGRAFGSTGTTGSGNVRVELYNTSGTFVTSTTTAADGTYSFTGLANGTYYVRVANDTVRSIRTGSDGTESGIQTYRTDGTTAAANEIGGRKPASTDAVANTTNQTLNTTTFMLSGGGQVQSVQPVTLSGSNVVGVNFGFNFSTVVNTNDSGQGSLRQAILNANLLANAGIAQPNSTYGINTTLSKEVLVFNIPGSNDPLGRTDVCGGVTCSITVNTQLPYITAPLIIDGTTQPGYVAGTPGIPRIRLSPKTGLDAIGIYIAYTATDSTVRGLSITGFRTNAMNRAINSKAARTVIESNYIGVKPDGTADANGQGIMLEYADSATSIIGGATASKRNIISGNLNWGIAYDTGATGTSIQNNFIGTTVNGTAALGNGGGIDLESANDTQILDNVIAANGGDGIQIGYINATILTSGYTITGNRIGVGINGEALGNKGPGIANYGGSSNHLIKANTIAYNSVGGINMYNPSVSGVVISQNAIYANGSVGIDLGHDGVTVNDANDTDVGANSLLNFPVLQQVTLAGGTVTARGCAPAGAVIEFFKADVSSGGAAKLGDNRFGLSQDYGEGQVYLGTMTEGSAADTDSGSCNIPGVDGNNHTGMRAFQFSVSAPSNLAEGDYLTATATLSAIGTSEFSPTINVINSVPPVSSGDCSATGGSDILFIVDNSGSITQGEYTDFANTIQQVGAQIRADNPANRIAIAHFGGPMDSLISGGQYVYIERDFSNTAMTAPVRQFGYNGAYNVNWSADHLAGAVQQMRYALDGDPTTTSSYIVSSIREMSRNLASPLQVVLMTDAIRYDDSTPTDISMLIDPPGSGAEPDDGSNFTIYNQLKAQGVGFSVVSFNPDLTDIAASAAIASVGGSYTGTIEANPKDPQGSKATPRRFISVTAGFQLTAAQINELVESTAICSSHISGTVFEDVNYGGGNGRAFSTPGTVGVAGATVEVYDATGTYIASVTTSTGGTFKLPNLKDADYYVRVVSDSVHSSRLGSNGTEKPVMTYRSNGTTATVNEIGGYRPLVVDASSNSGSSNLNTSTLVFSNGALAGKQAQAVQRVSLTGSSINGANFGFNFDTIVNANDSGQGSLRQALYNASLLGGDSSLAQVNQVAGKESLIFNLSTADPHYTIAANVWTIPLTSPLPTITQPIVLDGTKQAGFIDKPVIALDGSNAGNSDGLTLDTGSDGSIIQALSIHHHAKAGIGIVNSANNLIGGTTSGQGNVLIANQGAGVRVVGATALNNSILGNSINLNGGLGIDLGDNGVTANDAGDSDSGPNHLLNYPEVTLNGFGTNGTRILAYDLTLDAPVGNYRLEFFTSPSADASGYGEGQTFLGAKDINQATAGTASVRGTLNITQAVAAGAIISTTLTAKTASGFGSTSEFSAQYKGTNTSVCQDLTTTTNSQTVMINENTSPLAMLKAKDSTGVPINYVISGGLDKNLFILSTPATGATMDCTTINFVTTGIIITRSAALDSTTGKTRATSAPVVGDYEQPLDSNQDNIYELQITATLASGTTVVRDLRYKVLNINEAPVITSPTSLTLTEQNGVKVMTVAVYDPDQNDSMRFTLSGGNDVNQFAIDAATGALTFRNEPDYDSPTDTNLDNVYTVNVTVTDAAGLNATKTFIITVANNTDDDGVVLSTKVLLQGAYERQTGLMQASLNAAGLIPQQQPFAIAPFNYAGKERRFASSAVSDEPSGVVDWVLLELQNAQKQVMATQAALVQRNGVVVSAQTGSPFLPFAQVPAGNYYVSLRHRNHLGVITQKSQALSAKPILVDFTNPETAVLGADARLVVDNNTALLWVGDLNGNQLLSASGPNNDMTAMLNAVLLEPENILAVTNWLLKGYHVADVNMDGKVVFNGPNNDANILLGNILLHPQNTKLASNFIARGSLAP